jgi:methyl-accepting chemotaxis protein
VQRAYDAFASIGTSIEDMTIRVGEIATGIGQLAADAQRVEQDMSEVAASARELASTAAGLEELVRSFRLNEEPAPATV